MLHRNSQRRIYLEDVYYFITFKTYDNFPYFRENIFCDIFIKNLKLSKELKQFELFGFNILYEHTHLLLKPSREYNISKIIKSLKENISCDVNRVMGINEGETPAFRLQGIYKNKKMDFEMYRSCFIKKYGINQNEFPQFKWQKSFYDHIIRNDDDLKKHYDYTVNNHLKHGLPDNWKYTSDNFPEIISEI